MKTKTCKYCGSSFEGKRTDAIFCSNSCRSSHNQKLKQSVETTKDENHKSYKNKLSVNYPLIAVNIAVISVFFMLNISYNLVKSYRNYQTVKLKSEITELNKKIDELAEANKVKVNIKMEQLTKAHKEVANLKIENEEIKKTNNAFREIVENAIITGNLLNEILLSKNHKWMDNNQLMKFKSIHRKELTDLGYN